MPSNVIDLKNHAGQWIAQDANGEIILAAATYHELATKLVEMGIDVHRVALTEVPKGDGLLLL